MINNRPNFKNNSQAFAYAAYMMIGSYFKKCTCLNAMKEDKFYVAYCEAGNKRQFDFEERAEKYAVKNIFGKSFDESLLDYEAEVHFVENEDGIDVVFYGGFFKLIVSCGYKNGRASITHASSIDAGIEAEDNSFNDKREHKISNVA